ncbi:MAG: hypothetical protein JNL98_33185 [Bryobacterales bacterium]|nr:hypothetical protein [Bryobacterales bacterium]
MADDILRAINRCKPNEPLEPGDDRFVDFDGVRGVAVQSRMLRFLEAANADRSYAHIAFAGHRGGGKSTELYRVVESVEKHGHITLFAKVTDEADSKEVSFSDVFRLMIRKLEERFGHLAATHAGVEAAFHTVARWFEETTELKQEQVERTLQLGLDIAAGGNVDAEGEAGAPGAKVKFKTGLGRILAAIGIQRQSRTTERQEIRRKIEQYPDALLENLNLLLSEIRATGEVQRLLFVLDNVDRYVPEVVNDVFLRNAGLFTAVEAHLIFTVPISLLYNPVEDAVSERYQTLTLPMLPVFLSKTRTVNADVVDRIEEAVYRRVAETLFVSREVVRGLIVASGGCWRDLLRLIQSALMETITRVGEAEASRAVRVVRGEFTRPITRAHYGVLASVHLDKRIDPTRNNQWLLFHRVVLEYNGDGWVDVHPLVEATDEFAEALANERRARSLPGGSTQ